MVPKQKEMDGIVEKIHRKITEVDSTRSLPTLFILCSDHGMNEVHILTYN